MGYYLTTDTETVHCQHYDDAVSLIAYFMARVDDPDIRLALLGHMAEAFGAEVTVAAPEDDEAALVRVAQTLFEAVEPETLQ